MTDASASEKLEEKPKGPDEDVDAKRMSFGDHLEELRSRLVRALVGLAIASALSLYFGREVLVVLCRPLLVVLDAHGMPPSLMAMGVTDPFVNFLKMGLLTGLIISMPWMIYQVWAFVAAGLYSHERRFVRLFGPVSLVLFAGGVAFMYFIVLPIVLNFFITFNESFGMPDLDRSGLFGILFEEEAPVETKLPEGDWPSIPLVEEDPTDPPLGSVWVHPGERRLKIRTEAGVLAMPLELEGSTTTVRSEFALQFYISFVLALALAFGLAFELPIAVVFLSLTRIAPARAMAKARRYAILGIFVATALLTPPDVISQILLALPMIVLFESGLLAARIIERRHPAEDTDSLL